MGSELESDSREEDGQEDKGVGLLFFSWLEGIVSWDDSVKLDLWFRITGPVSSCFKARPRLRACS